MERKTIKKDPAYGVSKQEPLPRVKPSPPIFEPHKVGSHSVSLSYVTWDGNNPVDLEIRNYYIGNISVAHCMRQQKEGGQQTITLKMVTPYVYKSQICADGPTAKITSWRS